MTPYLTFISYSRNDGYGGGLQRFQHALDTFCEQLNAHALPAELIVVDWNPPAGAPGLAQALRFPPDGSFISARVIAVPPRCHTRYRGHAERGVQGAAAFNVGLRRARGRFVVLRSSDVYYSDALLARLSRRDLDERAVYRVERYDVDAIALADAPPGRDAFLAACASHVVERHRRIPPPREFGIRNLHTNACGDFILMSRDRWYGLHGYPEGDSVACLDADSIVLHAAVGGGAREEILGDPCRVYKTAHARQSTRRIALVFRRHEQALDDLLSRAGLPRLQLGMRVLLDFPRRTVSGLSGTFVSFERNFLPAARRWARGAGPQRLNASAEWGLAGESLEEHTVSRARWEAAGEPAEAAAPAAG